MKMLGSAMLAWAASKEEVLEKLKKDVYTENQVWDWSKVSLIFLLSFPLFSKAQKRMRFSVDKHQEL